MIMFFHFFPTLDRPRWRQFTLGHWRKLLMSLSHFISCPIDGRISRPLQYSYDA